MKKTAYARLSVLLFCFLAQPVSVQAAPTSQLYSAVPPLLSKSSDPLVMLVMSVDHELFKKAYPDYSDLDDDGQLDTTYKDNFDYHGYFESNWCYSYSSSNKRYKPEVAATGTNLHYCESSNSHWSGNFLNWATMSRIDILRRVLFGGKRSTDSNSMTVLERAYLPRDIHAFVKVYSGTDIAKLTPYNETISLCNLAVSENGEPKVRIARGNSAGSTGWPRWASTELKQCQWGGDSSPSTGNKLAEQTVRVESCVAGKDRSESRCKEYSSGSYKPTGLLQRYGEDGSIRFGLISGSYDKNISGGLLRRNISKIGGNTDSNDNEINLGNGTFNSSVDGIIHHINHFRIAKYSYSGNKYTDCNTSGISVSSFKSSRSTYSSRHCSNWGNPLAEMYLEALRYFAGESSPTSAFNTSSDSVFVPGISTESWVNPLSAANACANCSIIVLSTGLNSFDSDELGSSADLPGLSGAASVSSKTDEVGNIEYGNSFAGKYLVGGTGNTRQCTAKHLNGLSEAKGICPELPQLEGSYQITGLAYYGNGTDLRPMLEGTQSVKTYAIQMADSMPSFTLDVGGNPVTFQPVCKAYNSGRDCTLTDVVIDELSPDGMSGTFIFTWEDSLWGNDFDYDASSSIEYCIGSACTPSIGNTQVKITVRQEAKNSGAETWYSYSVTGTDGSDGTQLPLAKDASNSQKQGPGAPVTRTFNSINTSAGILPKPLFLAAKYGGYLDQDGDGTPKNTTGDSREWDTRNNSTGSIGADGLPDNYFFARNPALLEAQLGQILQDIASRVSSATNTALLSNSNTGTGVLYQALFQPSLEFNGKSITWGGMLHALFVDSKGLLREDTNGNDQLDGYNTDSIVELVFDPNANQTMLQRYMTDDEGETLTATGSLRPLTALNTIWDARDQLSDLTNVTSQRNYNSSAASGRYIFTWLDADNDGIVDNDEDQPFIPGSFAGGLEGYLNIPASEVTTIVNYVRGQESSRARSRTIDYDGDGDDDIWRLGDIVHSTPQLVATPNTRYDAYYQDSSYQAFREHYANRRHVLFAGANDGMIHAFNGGFWDEENFAYDLTGSNGETSHPLGSELWAYTPMNLLPHLRWLAEKDYPHVYYMDGEPLTFDANIFDPLDSDYPGGWGTVLVVGMRLGGGALDVMVDGTSRTMRSAYVVLDVTNPEQPPKLLAEITHPELGLTTSKPVWIKKRVADLTNGEPDWSKTPVTNEWYLVFASGPTGTGETGIRAAIEQGTSDQNLRLFAYDLKNKAFVSGLDPLTSSISSSYGGDLTVVDWDNDYKDDVVYFGAIETGNQNLGGKLLRLSVSNLSLPSLTTLLNTGTPITSAPHTLKDQNHNWVYAGSGRLLTYFDNSDTQQQLFYGVKEPMNANGKLTFATQSLANTVDTTDVEVLSSGSIRAKSGNSYTSFKVDKTVIANFNALKSVLGNKPGWKIRLEFGNSQPSGRNVSSASRLFSMLFFTEYLPSEDSCRAEGRSYLRGVHYQTGTATPVDVLDYVDSGDEDDPHLSVSRVFLGIGYSSAPVIHQGQDGRRSAVTQGAGGSIDSQNLNYNFTSSGRLSWRQIFDIPW